MKTKNRILKRLTPLYAAIFLQGFVLWYAVEKLFMVGIGFDSASIGMMAAVYAGTMLIVETPSGLLADRWSRKGVLILAGLTLAAASLVGGLSSDPSTYLIATILWGAFYALQSGTYDSIVYDTLLEETGQSKGYEKYYGRTKVFDGLALIAGSLLGGLVGQIIGTRETYFITVPIALLSVLALWFLKEPKLHKAVEHVSLKSQVLSTFRAISRKGVVLWLLATLAVGGLMSQMVFEFNQLWLIALFVPVILYGPAHALLMLAYTTGGFIAKYLAGRKVLIYGLSVAVILSILCLVLARDFSVIMAAAFLAAALLVSYNIIFNKLMHDQIASNVRTGAMSAISTLSKLTFIPTAIGFGFISRGASVFDAAWVLVGLAVALVVLIIITFSKASSKESVAKDS